MEYYSTKEMAIQCMACGNITKVSSDSTDCFCSACGTHMVFDAKSRNKTFHEVSSTEARIEELSRRIDNMEQEIESLRYQLSMPQKKNISFMWIFSISAWLLSVLVFGIAGVITMDGAGFSFYEILALVDVIMGFRAITKFREKIQ